MSRFFLTICGTCMLAGSFVAAQQNPAQPQIRTGVGQPTAVRQPNGLPPARGVRAPVAPGPNRPAAVVQPPLRAAQANNPAPKKDPRIASTPSASAPTSTPAPMGPPAPPSVIPQPQRPADMPPVPPQVTYQNGLLTVNAVNSTMSSLLAAIRSRTGIEFDGAENASERVAVSLGPAPEGDVLAAIFSGSGFDYVVLGRADSPETVQKVVLTPKAKGGGGAVIAGRPPQQPPQAQVQPEAAEEEVPDESANVEQEPQDTAAQAPQVNPPPAPSPENQPQTGAPKTPEQLLQELKQMQQRQQEQQNGQPPGEQQPPTGNLAPRKNPSR